MATDPDELLREAEDLIEDWLCELDVTWQATLDGARTEAADIIALARLEAESLLASAREQAEAIVAAADAAAGEHADVIRALNEAERDAAGEELAALKEAVERLRTELSRLVDAAFDALPAVEATAEAIEQVEERRRRRFLLFGKRR